MVELTNPTLSKNLCEVDYDYEVSISEEDIIDYLAPINMKELSQGFKNGFKTAIGRAINEDLINFDDLEDDKYFIKFMTEKIPRRKHTKSVWMKMHNIRRKNYDYI